MPTQTFNRSALALSSLGVASAGLGYAFDIAWVFFPGLLMLAAGCVLRAALAHSGRRKLALALWLGAAGAVLAPLLAEPFFLMKAYRAADLSPFDWSFERMHSDPAAFVRAWNSRRAAFRENLAAGGGMIRRSTDGRLPYEMVPGHYPMGANTLEINSLGLRGSEVPVDKGDRYRILAVGESTTFGYTPVASDRPWPELLEERIARSLTCKRPVEVLNAGVAAYSLAWNVVRFNQLHARLKPDLLISSHGYNGFRALVPQIAEVRSVVSPRAPKRPSSLLAGAETALRAAQFRRGFASSSRVDESVLDMDVLTSPYAKHYEGLVRATEAVGARLVLLTFNMAVNRSSPEEVVDLYELVFPDVRAAVFANVLHTRLVKEFGALHGLPVIDTSAGLDGLYRGNYYDLMHFRQIGRERLTENIYEGLVPVLMDDPKLGCRERLAAEG